jgi:flagellar hook-basal body complex protein FliE
MSPIGSVTSQFNPLPVTLATPPAAPTTGGAQGAAGSTPPAGFGALLDNMVSMVSNKESQAQSVTNNVILGQSDQLHQSVIAMQEASVALSLMVQVRNKLVDSYQELMRMQV